MMAWSYRKNARHPNPKKDVVRKVVCNKTKRKTKNEMAGWHVHGSEKDGCKRMERQSKELRSLEAHYRGGQGPPQDVAPSGGGLMSSWRWRDWAQVVITLFWWPASTASQTASSRPTGTKPNSDCRKVMKEQLNSWCCDASYKRYQSLFLVCC